MKRYLCVLGIIVLIVVIFHSRINFFNTNSRSIFFSEPFVNRYIINDGGCHALSKNEGKW